MNKYSANAWTQNEKASPVLIQGFGQPWKNSTGPAAGYFAVLDAPEVPAPGVIDASVGSIGLRRPAAVMEEDRPGGAAVTAQQIHSTLTLILASAIFSKAQRMRHLLRFLVEQALAGTIRDTTEYAIGIEVFGRDPANYNTCDDPIVRVQIGRLREKLKIYYATSGEQDDLRIIIPVGSYMPAIHRLKHRRSGVKRKPMLAILPLKSITPVAGSDAFTQGLSEELAYQLFKELGDAVVSFDSLDSIHEMAAPKNAEEAGSSYILEGSVRVEGDRLRISIRLLDAAARCIAWSEQFDRSTSLDIALQEELAQAIRTALISHFCLA